MWHEVSFYKTLWNFLALVWFVCFCFIWRTGLSQSFGIYETGKEPLSVRYNRIISGAFRTLLLYTNWTKLGHKRFQQTGLKGQKHIVIWKEPFDQNVPCVTSFVTRLYWGSSLLYYFNSRPLHFIDLFLVFDETVPRSSCGVQRTEG